MQIIFTIFFLLPVMTTVNSQTLVDHLPSGSNNKPVADTGVASYYHSKLQGRPTASGEKYDEMKMTAAHNHLEFGTMIKVTNLRNMKSIIVRVNDRLHYRNTRIVDLSRAAAIKLGFIKRGLTKVKVEVVRDY